MSSEDKKFVLSSQADTFQHVQEQSQKFFRILLASGALLLGLAWSDIIDTITNLDGMQQLLSSTVVFQNGVAQNAPAIVDDSFRVGIYLSLIAFGLFFEAGITTIMIMRIDGPHPTARRKDISFENTVMPIEAGTIERWILANDELVTEAQLYLNRCFSSIWGAFGIGFLSLFIIAMTAFGFLGMMGLLNLAALLIGPVAAVYFLKDPVLEWYRAENYREKVNAALARYADTFEYVGPSAGMKIALLLIYGSMWNLSANVVWYWLQFPQ